MYVYIISGSMFNIMKHISGFYYTSFRSFSPSVAKATPGGHIPRIANNNSLHHQGKAQLFNSPSTYSSMSLASIEAQVETQ